MIHDFKSEHHSDYQNSINLIKVYKHMKNNCEGTAWDETQIKRT